MAGFCLGSTGALAEPAPDAAKQFVAAQSWAIAPSLALTANPVQLEPAETMNVQTWTQVPVSQPETLDSDPAVLESPTLQEWQQQVPNVLTEIQHDPAFQTRVRLGYLRFRSADENGLILGVEDLFVGQTRFTLSTEYQTSLESDRDRYGADLHYYLRPLGRHINLAPVVGYRHIQTETGDQAGLNLGVRLMLALSRKGATDIVLTQSWVDPGSDQEVGLTTLTFGYAIAPDLRLATDFQWQNTRQDHTHQVGILLEWMP